MDSNTQDAERYRFLRDTFAIDAADDFAEFAKLAALTGKKFDAFVDEAMHTYSEKQMNKQSKQTDWSAA